MQIAGIIPARFASTRFPGKPLVLINGISMIRRVYEQALKAKSLDTVIVATDDERIFEHIMDFGGNVMITAEHHSSGTDRCGEIITKLQIEAPASHFDVVVNIQGDEPFLFPEQIDQLTASFKNQEVEIATLARKIDDSEVLFNPNAVKVVTDAKGFALLFSRAAVPFLRNIPQDKWINNHSFLKHLGIYAYRTEILKEIIQLKPSILEIAESLEQLRWIENAYKIKVELTELESQSVDSPADLLKLNDLV